MSRFEKSCIRVFRRYLHSRAEPEHAEKVGSTCAAKICINGSTNGTTVAGSRHAASLTAFIASIRAYKCSSQQSDYSRLLSLHLC